MGHLLFYQSYDHHLGDVSIGRWREIQRLFPAFLEYVNSAMLLTWNPTTRRNVLLTAEGSMLPGEPPNVAPPSMVPFVLTGFIRDESDGLNEIYVTDAGELLRLFAWFDFLVMRDGAASLYSPFVEALRSCTYGIARFALRNNA